MEKKGEIMDVICGVIAKLFQKDPEYVKAHPELRLKEDLHADSKQYFPMISAIEDEFDLMIDYHYFQYEEQIGE